MAVVGYVFTTFVSSLLSIISIAMLARVLISLFDPMQEWPITVFLHVLTEPITLPVRAIFALVGIEDSFPIDIPYLITWFLLSVIQSAITLA